MTFECRTFPNENAANGALERPAAKSKRKAV